ncbi:helix-turn-helix transcriptional regulator [Joostella sp. CR20]|uniref:helix-turn-helix transcriptional regulator n=1 Tax=Joostella sp. CR20 TaxID=2804312 RepID=UPI00313BBFEA
MKVLEIYKSSLNPTDFNCGKRNVTEDAKTAIETTTIFDEKSIKGWFKELTYTEFKIGVSEFDVNKEELQLVCNYTDSVIEMIFIIRGNSKVYFNQSNNSQQFTSKTHNLFHCKNNKTEIKFKDTKSEFLIIELNTKFFKDLIPSEGNFEDFIQLIETNKTGCIKCENNTINSAMQLIIDDIKDLPKEGTYRKLFLHAKVLELLLLQLEQYNLTSSEKNKVISESDLIKIEKAKQYLLKNYKTPITIQRLAKTVGTNEFTLKKGFKTLYGETVFGCINNLKMNKAKRLLEEDGSTISQVSEVIGYKNPQHFSTAFKKKFGVAPSEFKLSSFHGK